MPILPFPERSATKRTWWQRLRQDCPPDTILAAVYQILAESPTIQSVSREDVSHILARYRTHNTIALEAELAGLYRQYLRHCLADRFLTNAEIADLAHLANVLGLSEETVATAREEVARQLYGSESAAAVEDGRVDAVEWEWLSYLRDYVQLPEPVAHSIFADAAERAYRKFLHEAIADRQLSPEEEIQLARIAAGLGVPAPQDSETLRTLERYRLFWRIENMRLPSVEGLVELNEGEARHWEEAGSAEPASAQDFGQAQGESARVSGLSAWFWRSARYRNRGALAPKLDPVTGWIAVTSRRLVFQKAGGQPPELELPLKDLEVEPIADGLWVRAGGASWVFRTEADIEIFHRILGRALRDAQGETGGGSVTRETAAE